MAFGKRSAGDLPSARLAAQRDDAPASDDTLLAAPGIGAVRTRVANPGDIDKNFIFLAAGVVVLAAGAAIAVPALLSGFGGGVRPIAEVIAGLDRPGVRSALASDAFPDADGRAFMVSLATNFPNEHGRLLDTLADTAMAGGNRDDLYQSLNAWTMTFAPGQLRAIGRSGARGFDEGVTIMSEALTYIDKEMDACTGAKMQRVLSDPKSFERFTTYGGNAYHFNVRSTTKLVELAAAGRNAPAISTQLTANDMSALQQTFFSMMGDSQVMSLVQAGMMAQNGGGFGSQTDMANNIDFCRLGQTVLIKLKGLPEGTKARLFGTIMSQDMRSLGANPFSGPSGGMQLNMLSGL